MYGFIQGFTLCKPRKSNTCYLHCHAYSGHTEENERKGTIFDVVNRLGCLFHMIHELRGSCVFCVKQACYRYEMLNAALPMEIEAKLEMYQDQVKCEHPSLRSINNDKACGYCGNGGTCVKLPNESHLPSLLRLYVQTIICGTPM